MTSLTFVIPVRHPANARDWAGLKRRLEQTIRSVSAQRHDDWGCVIVANRGSDLPDLPDRFRVEAVEFPPNPSHELGTTARNEVYDSLRFDKGRRVLAGLLSARDARFAMVVDDDDFVHRDLAGHVAEHPEANGWVIRRGYVWSEGSHFLMTHDDFSNYCGSSILVRSDLHRLPGRIEEADVDYMKQILGSHIFTEDHFARAGTPLQVLPFRGAIYRIGHTNAFTKSRGLFRTFFLNRQALSDPVRAAAAAARLRPLGARLRAAYFGG